MQNPLSQNGDQFTAPHRVSTALPIGLQETISGQENLIRRQEAALSEVRRTFEIASAAAGIGLWECRLANQSLTWSRIVYDMFDIPYGCPLVRERILKLYSDTSAHQLHLLRSKAIEERSGFTLDAEITTEKGNTRWIRITATVECRDGEPHRIFGMKQDITNEKILGDQTKYLAEFDHLTGLPNRSQFESTFTAMMGAPEAHDRLGALLIADLDGFKQVNDTFGHSEGDDCLKEAAFRLRTSSAGASLVARIGGDEFAILTAPSLTRDDVAEMARRIVDGLSWSVCHGGISVPVGVSVGIAYYEPCQPSQLFRKADTALYAAKNAGRGVFRTSDENAGPGLDPFVNAA